MYTEIENSRVKKYKLKIYIPMITVMILIMGTLTMMVNGWFILGIISLIIIATYIYNRSTNIDHYCVGVDLDTNNLGDIIEIMIYAFHKEKNQYYPIGAYYKQLRIFVDVILLDKFYENTGFQIRDDVNYGVRLVKNSRFKDIKSTKKFYREMVRAVNKSYAYSANSMQDRRIEQPANVVRRGFAGIIWNWWTLKKYI